MRTGISGYLLFLLCLSSESAQAELYKCRNALGETSYQSTPCPNPAEAAEITGLPPRNTEAIAEYEIYGSTIAELREQMALKGPVGQNNKRVMGHTTWDVKWKYRWLQSDDGCRISSFSTYVKITYLMPFWANEPRSGLPISQEWSRFYDALMQHEKGHGDFGLRAAKEIEDKVYEIGAKSNCGQLEQEINDLGRRVIARYAKLDDEYDALTQHGVTQGAIL